MKNLVKTIGIMAVLSLLISCYSFDKEVALREFKELKPDCSIVEMNDYECDGTLGACWYVEFKYKKKDSEIVSDTTMQYWKVDDKWITKAEYRDIIASSKVDKGPSAELTGYWTIQASCDESIFCNVCPRVLLGDNGIGMASVNSELLIDNFKWEIMNDKFKIINIQNSLIDDGDYSFTFRKDGEGVSLKLINVKNNKCYLLVGRRDSSNPKDQL